MPCDDGIRSSIAVLNARCAAVITRHSDHSGRRVGAADDGDQDVDTGPEPDLRETARPSVAALLSVGGPHRRLLPPPPTTRAPGQTEPRRPGLTIIQGVKI